METSTSRSPKANEFVIPDGVVYARIDPHICEVIEFLMTKLVLIHLEDLDIDNQVCPMCQLDWCVTEDP